MNEERLWRPRRSARASYPREEHRRGRDVDELALGGCRSEVDTKSIRESSFLARDVDRDIVPGRYDGGWRLERNEGEPA